MLTSVIFHFSFARISNNNQCRCNSFCCTGKLKKTLPNLFVKLFVFMLACVCVWNACLAVTQGWRSYCRFPHHVTT